MLLQVVQGVVDSLPIGFYSLSERPGHSWEFARREEEGLSVTRSVHRFPINELCLGQTLTLSVVDSMTLARLPCAGQ